MTTIGRIEPHDWIALSGVLAAFLTGFTATCLAYRESVEARRERLAAREDERRASGRRAALATLTPLFAFIADLEKAAKASEHDQPGFARYTREKVFGRWEQELRPIMLGLTASAGSEQVRAEARRVVDIVDGAIASQTFEIEFIDELSEFSDDEAGDIASELVHSVALVRASAERIAAVLREGV